MHLVGVPTGLGDVLRVAVVPIGWIARIVVVVVIPGLAFLGCLPGRHPSAVRVFGFTEPLGVFDEHAGCQHDLVVVSEHAFDGGRILERIARHIGVQHVETAQPPAVEHSFVDIVFLGFHVRNVIDPPLVVGGHGILVGSGRIGEIAVESGFVFRGGVRQLVGDQAKLQLGGLWHVRFQGEGGSEFAVLYGETVAGEPWIDGGQIVLHIEATGQFSVAVIAVLCEWRGCCQRYVTAGGAGDGEIRDHHIGVGDVLDFGDGNGLVAVGEFRGEVAWRLLALVGVLAQGLLGTANAYLNGKAVVAGLIPVCDISYETKCFRRMRVHECGTAT